MPAGQGVPRNLGCWREPTPPWRRGRRAGSLLRPGTAQGQKESRAPPRPASLACARQLSASVGRSRRVPGDPASGHLPFGRMPLAVFCGRTCTVDPLPCQPACLMARRCAAPSGAPSPLPCHGAGSGGATKAGNLRGPSAVSSTFFAQSLPECKATRRRYYWRQVQNTPLLTSLPGCVPLALSRPWTPGIVHPRSPPPATFPVVSAGGRAGGDQGPSGTFGNVPAADGEARARRPWPKRLGKRQKGPRQTSGLRPVQRRGADRPGL